MAYVVHLQTIQKQKKPVQDHCRHFSITQVSLFSCSDIGLNKKNAEKTFIYFDYEGNNIWNTNSFRIFSVLSSLRHCWCTDANTLLFKKLMLQYPSFAEINLGCHQNDQIRIYVLYNKRFHYSDKFNNIFQFTCIPQSQ